MFANKLRAYRARRGLSQAALASSINLSLRTIQRVESGKTSPKGHTLLVLSELLALDLTEVQANKTNSPTCDAVSLDHVKLINLAAFGFIGVPFGNLIFPFMLWKKYKADVFVNKMGKKIINAQLLWSLVLMFVLIVAPFLQDYFPSNFIVILWVGLGMVLLNVILILRTGISLSTKQFDILDTKIRLL